MDRRTVVALAMLAACARGSVAGEDAPGLDASPTAHDATPDATVAAAACAPTSEPVGAAGDASVVRLAIGPDGEAHVVVIPALGTGTELRHLRRGAGGSWAIEPIATDASVQVSSLEVDRAGGLHLAYVTRDGHALRVGARPAHGSWRWAVARTATSAIQGLDLAVDPAGGARLAFTDGAGTTAGAKLFVARPTGATWTAAVVPVPGTVAGIVALAVDAAGAEHVTYALVGGNSLIWIGYARAVGGGWDATTLSEPNSNNSALGLALDDAGRPHVAYGIARHGSGTVHTTMVDGRWRSEMIDRGAYPPTIVVGPQGPRVLELSQRYGRWQVAGPAANQTWDTLDVRRAVRIPSADLAIDPAGGLHVASIDDDGTLVYTRACDPIASTADWRY